MKLSIKLLTITLIAAGQLAQTASALIIVETVRVGDAGNAADTNYFNQGAFGAVGYDYFIGQYEVTLDQYTAFLNAVGATDTYGLYHLGMGTNTSIRGISRSGVSGSFSYSVIGSGNRPVTYVSWYDAARFVNWLHNGQPSGLQAAGTTETGAYSLTGNTGLIPRNTNWMYGLPSQDEWYKAAYYQPAAQGGDTDSYWFYPAQSNATPNSRNGSGSDSNSANFYQNDSITNGYNGGFAVNNATTLPVGSVLTDAGAFNVADSFYGTFDQGGNVWEWNNAVVFGAGRGKRGGSWASFESNLSASDLAGNAPTEENQVLGFRVAMRAEARPVLSLARSGNTLTFSWTGNFKLQAQTNSLTSGISTNWSDYPLGSNSPVNLDIHTTNPAVFFRLSSP